MTQPKVSDPTVTDTTAPDTTAPDTTALDTAAADTTAADTTALDTTAAARPHPTGLHHVELWVPDLAGALPGWQWLLETMGWTPYQDWDAGRSWRLGDVYVVIEQSAALTATDHDRCRPGLNHLAFHAGDRADVDALVTAAAEHGWTLMFADRHPHAGGPEHYAAYLHDPYGYEVELIAEPS